MVLSVKFSRMAFTARTILILFTLLVVAATVSSPQAEILVNSYMFMSINLPYSSPRQQSIHSVATRNATATTSLTGRRVDATNAPRCTVILTPYWILTPANVYRTLDLHSLLLPPRRLPLPHLPVLRTAVTMDRHLTQTHASVCALSQQHATHCNGSTQTRVSVSVLRSSQNQLD